MKDPLDIRTPDMFGEPKAGHIELLGPGKIKPALINEWLMTPSHARLPYLEWVHERKKNSR